MEKEIMVSIICNAYNHEDYIRDALDSFLMQKTNFAFEILIHDDASTDNTASIIKEYEEKYPNIIKPVYQKENKYSKGISITLEYQYPRVKGKYIALCEGDDYWIDENKLQKQFEKLETHPDVDICTHAANLYLETQKENIDIIKPSRMEGIIKTRDVIIGNSKFIFVATSSLFYRSNVLNYDYTFYRKFHVDHSIYILGSLRGGMYFLKEVMSTYRAMSKGSWGDRGSKNKQLLMEHSYKLLEMYEKLNQETSYIYNNTINMRKNEVINNILRMKNIDYIYDPQYSEMYNLIIKSKNTIFKNKIKLFLKRKFFKTYNKLKLRNINNRVKNEEQNIK